MDRPPRCTKCKVLGLGVFLADMCSHEVKKSIARVLTVIGEQQRHHTREMYLAEKQPLPLDLRPKLTKRIRQRMTDRQLSYRTMKEWRTMQRRRLRRYAIMA